VSYHLGWVIGTALLIAAIPASLTVLRPAGVAAPIAEAESAVEALAPGAAYREAA
jgi:hypothetical protein